MKKKIILAYSGGLDSTVIIPWLKENQDCEIIAVCIDIGQAADWKAIAKRALAIGAVSFHIADVKKEYIEDYIWPTLKSGAVYENKYLLGTATARPLIAKVLVDFARKEKATAIAHGATGKGNDQARFELAITALAPDLEIIAPWQIWKLKGRDDEIRYLSRRKINTPFKKKTTYSIDNSLWHNSIEGLDLEDPENEVQYKKLLSMTSIPEKAPNKPEYLEIEFEKGIPVAVNGKKMEAVSLINYLNKIGASYGIGITNLVENRLSGMKNRSIYETPGGSILYYAHQELEHICLDRHAFSFKQHVSLKLSELIYGGQWFTVLREALSAFVDKTQETVSGKVKVKLFKGSISSVSASSAYSLYNTSLANLSTGELFNQADSKGFVKLYGLPFAARSLTEQGKKGSSKMPSSSSKVKNGKKSAKKK